MLRTLFVHTPGTRLVLEGNAVKALRDDAPPRRLPLEAIDTVVVTAGVDVSTPLLIHCAEAGRVVAFLSTNGKPRAVVEGVADGRSALRRLQYAAHADPLRRSLLAANIVEGKVRQMSWALRQWARDAEEDDQVQLRHTADSLDARFDGADREARSRDELLGIEGESSRRYFQGLGLALQGQTWPGRVRRPTTDPLNATLSWLYGMTRLAVQGAVLVAGLDAGTGFLHGDRPGQPSLALDLMEEFRPSADRLAVKLWNTKRLQARHVDRSLGGVTEFNAAGREVLFDAWHEFRAREVSVVGRAQRVSNAFLPIMQAHAMANALRNGTAYKPHRQVVK